MKKFYHNILPLLVIVMLLVGCATNNYNKVIPNDSFISISNKAEYPDYVWKSDNSDVYPTPPNIIYAPQPSFPHELIGVMEYGEAIVCFVVEKNGRASHVQVTEATNRFFAEAAMNAVVEWRFEPGILDGEAVAIISKKNFKFFAP